MQNPSQKKSLPGKGGGPQSKRIIRENLPQEGGRPKGSGPADGYRGVGDADPTGNSWMQG